MSFIFNIPAMIAHQGRVRADYAALIDFRGEVSYGELERRVSQWANHFRTLGLRPGDHIGLCFTDHSDHVIAILAAMRAQNPFLCMDWRMSQQEVEDRVAKFDLRLVICDPEARISLSIGLLRDGEWQESIDRASDKFPLPSLAEGATALLAASSGTTGKPEVVRVTHRALTARAVSDNWLTHSPNAGDKVLRALPTAYSLGRGFNFTYLCCGCPSVLMPSLYSPAEYVDAIQRHNVTHANANPRILRRLIDHATETGHLLDGLKVLNCTGATLSSDLKRQVIASVTPNLFDKYGTVATGIVTVARPEDLLARPGSVGRPAFGVELEIVDDDDHEVPAGTPGSVRCRSPQAADPFEDDMEETDRTRRRMGFWYTDDYGKLDEDGFLHLTGRNASLIIRAGVNIYAEEIEEILMDHPRVKDVAVLGRASVKLGDEPVALVVRRKSSDITAQELIAYCRTKLSRLKVPTEVLFVDDLPRGSADKLMRAALPELLRTAMGKVDPADSFPDC